MRRLHFPERVADGNRRCSYLRSVQSDVDRILAAFDRLGRKLDDALDRVHRELPARIVDQLRGELGEVRALAADPCCEAPPLSVKEVAVRLGRKPRWVYDHQHELGVVRHGGRLAFPATRIDEVRTRGLSVAPLQPDVIPTPRYLRDRRTRRQDAA
jgi:hypothetical protein